MQVHIYREDGQFYGKCHSCEIVNWLVSDYCLNHLDDKPAFCKIHAPVCMDFTKSKGGAYLETNAPFSEVQ